MPRHLSCGGGGEGSRAADQECGNTWQGSLARLDPSTSLWRTAQCSLLEDSELSLQTFPRWGLMQNGALYQLPILVQTISVKEFGSEPKQMWLTPRVVEVDESPENFRRRMNSKRPNDRKDGFGSLTMQVKWLSPTCMDALPPRSPQALKKQYDSNRQGRETHSTLREQVAYPPPNQMWPTPATRDYKGANGFKTTQSKILEGKRSHMGQLPNAVMMEQQAAIGGTLNPTWVEWLMGWPLGWTDLKPLEMDKFRQWQEKHGTSCAKEPPQERPIQRTTNPMPVQSAGKNK